MPTWSQTEPEVNSRDVHERLDNVGRFQRLYEIFDIWLKLKYPTGQNAISRQPCEIFIPKFIDIYGTDPATILKFKKNI